MSPMSYPAINQHLSVCECFFAKGMILQLNVIYLISIDFSFSLSSFVDCLNQAVRPIEAWMVEQRESLIILSWCP